jgi:hypothetical protein
VDFIVVYHHVDPVKASRRVSRCIAGSVKQFV